MKYVDYEFYKSLYGEKAIQEADFNRLSFEACRKIDIATTGVDGFRKLNYAFPHDEYASECVRRCICKVIERMNEIIHAEERAEMSHGYIQNEDGTVKSKLVTSVSAGNESISYSSSVSSNTPTLIDKALSDKEVQDKIYKDVIQEYLSGITDANGVNLLYMGSYPYNEVKKCT